MAEVTHGFIIAPLPPSEEVTRAITLKKRRLHMCLHMCAPSPIESQMLDKSQSYSICFSIFCVSSIHPIFLFFSKVLSLYFQQLQCDFGTRNSIFRSYPIIPKATSCPWFGISGSVNCWSVVLSFRPLEKWLCVGEMVQVGLNADKVLQVERKFLPRLDKMILVYDDVY